EKIADVRELVSGMGSEELVDIDVNVDSKSKESPAAGPMEGALASKEQLMKVEALMDLSADELAEVSETLDNLDAMAKDQHSMVLKAAKAALEDSDAILVEASKLVEAAKKKDKKEDKDEDKEDKEEDKDED